MGVGGGEGGGGGHDTDGDDDDHDLTQHHLLVPQGMAILGPCIGISSSSKLPG